MFLSVVVAAPSTATSTVAIAVTVIATLVIVALTVALVVLLRSAAELGRAAQVLQRESQALLGELNGTLDHTREELARVDGLIGSAESITETVGSASRLAYLALANPVVKAMAFGAGTSNASRHWRARRTGR
ncbi:MAG: hypothetical protein M3R71_02060, partial [Actinomycetota bacterium]|nr:hypothetical protein [Actinomycetota bacterium]